MISEVIRFINNNELSPFSLTKTSVKSDGEKILKTKDAKSVYTRTLTALSKEFNFSDTSGIWHSFPFTLNHDEILGRQKFFESLKSVNSNSSFLKSIKKPRPFWRPSYSFIVVTEDEGVFSELQKLNCASKYLVSPHDVESLDSFDLVQVIECDQFKLSLEQLPQSFFVDSLDDVYLERYVELLSGWKENLEILKDNNPSESIMRIVNDLSPLLSLVEGTEVETLSQSDVEASLVQINNEISEKMKELTMSGESLFTMLSKNNLPPELEKIIRDSILRTGFPLEIFNSQIPVSIDEEELQRRIMRQKASEFTDRAAVIKSNASKLRSLPNVLRDLENQLLIFDFASGIKNYLNNSTSFPRNNEVFNLHSSKNIFLDNAQPVSFNLSPEHKCSILTGANSGGKTTLLEHILQLISIYQLGLPTIGSFSTPMFSEIYYFAKNKGSMSKGAFETLLSQMDCISPGKQTLILADEIEAVTEPGVAGKMICATADYFVKSGCYLVIATHLGHEIAKNLPSNSRIDGIEAKGLDENFELVVDHNPVLGRLAHSTPELIIEKMANAQNTPYFSHLRDSLK